MHIHRVSHSVSEWHSDKVDWSGKKADFSNFDSLPWQRPLKNQKKLNELSKPLHLSTNPEILVKIALLVSQLRWLESRPLKKNKTRNAWQSLAYSPLGATVSPPSRY